MGDRFSTGKKNIMKFFDPLYALDLPLNPTSVTEKIIPAESALHPHSGYLVKEKEKRAKKKRAAGDALELDRARKQIAQQAYPSQNMRRGGRVKLIDGCAVSGKTRGRTV